MNGLALVVALAVAQAGPTPAAADRLVAEPAPAAADRPVAEPVPAAAPDRTAPKQAPSAVPAVAERPGAAPADTTASPLVRPDGGTEVKAAPRQRRAPAPSPAPLPQASPLPERDAAERAARAFLDALAGADADALAQASAERFSFDGETQAGRDAIRRTWRDLLAARAPAASRPAVGRVEVLTAADATARYGKPPARIAPLARGGVLVAVGEVGGRTVVLFLGPEAGRMAVLGMHD
jgi:hypothetical protein